MVKIRKYKVGTYTSTGKPVRKNKTYRGKPTKAVKAKNMLKAKIVLFIGLIAISNAILVQNNSYNIESVGGAVEAQNTEEAETAKQDYSTVGSDKINFAPLAVESGVITEITAYNAGDPLQCDNDPCISASGDNICTLLAQGQNVCASNYYNLGTVLEIKGLGECIVLDRMNSRFKNRIDWAMTADKKAEAVSFGLKHLEVIVKS